MIAKIEMNNSNKTKWSKESLFSRLGLGLLAGAGLGFHLVDKQLGFLNDLSLGLRALPQAVKLYLTEKKEWTLTDVWQVLPSFFLLSNIVPS